MEHNGGERTCIVAWCDFDNDGRLDILLSGYSHTAGHAITQIWRNTGGGFTNIQANLPGLMSGDASCGDFDNDGWMDLMLAGQTNYYAASCDIWRNIGGGFSNLNAGLTPILRHCAAKSTDYNGDGRLDILLSGIAQSGDLVNELWQNKGDSFVKVNSGIPGHWSVCPAWGDFDNDGRPDVVIPDYVGCKAWRNEGSNFIQMPTSLPVFGFNESWAAWGDYDNDGRLDLLVAHYMYPYDCCGARGSRSPVWHNILPNTNTPPTAPTNLLAVPAADHVSLTWSAATDAQTPNTGLAYNLRVGTKPGGADVVNPQADLVTGRKRVPDLGNCQYSRTKIITQLLPGIYYWSVQAVDTGYAGGPFATEGCFSIGGASRIMSAASAPGAGFRLGILGASGATYSVLATTNLKLSAAEWTVAGAATELSPGRYEFIDTETECFARRFYQLRAP